MPPGSSTRAGAATCASATELLAIGQQSTALNGARGLEQQVVRWSLELPLHERFKLKESKSQQIIPYELVRLVNTRKMLKCENLKNTQWMTLFIQK